MIIDLFNELPPGVSSVDSGAEVFVAQRSGVMKNGVRFDAGGAPVWLQNSRFEPVEGVFLEVINGSFFYGLDVQLFYFLNPLNRPMLLFLSRGVTGETRRSGIPGLKIEISKILFFFPGEYFYKIAKKRPIDIFAYSVVIF